MNRRPASGVEIDRQAGAMTKAEMIRRKSGVLKSEIKTYKKRLMVAALIFGGCFLWLGIKGFVFWSMEYTPNSVRSHVELPMLTVWIFGIIGFLNMFYFFYKQRQSQRKLVKWEMELEAYKARKAEK